MFMGALHDIVGCLILSKCYSIAFRKSSVLSPTWGRPASPPRWGPPCQCEHCVTSDFISVKCSILSLALTPRRRRPRTATRRVLGSSASHMNADFVFLRIALCSPTSGRRWHGHHAADRRAHGSSASTNMALISATLRPVTALPDPAIAGGLCMQFNARPGDGQS